MMPPLSGCDFFFNGTFDELTDTASQLADDLATTLATSIKITPTSQVYGVTSDPVTRSPQYLVTDGDSNKYDIGDRHSHKHDR